MDRWWAFLLRVTCVLMMMVITLAFDLMFQVGVDTRCRYVRMGFVPWDNAPTPFGWGWICLNGRPIQREDLLFDGINGLSMGGLVILIGEMGRAALWRTSTISFGLILWASHGYVTVIMYLFALLNVSTRAIRLNTVPVDYLVLVPAGLAFVTCWAICDWIVRRATERENQVTTLGEYLLTLVLCLFTSCL